MTRPPVDPAAGSAPHPAAGAPAHHRRRYKPLPPNDVYYRHVMRNGILGVCIGGLALLIGVVGYHLTAGFGWLDSLENASMILGGMGPVDPVVTTGGKWFASFYALFAGVVFISTVGVVLAPTVRRFLHRFHLGIEEDDPTQD